MDADTEAERKFFDMEKCRKHYEDEGRIEYDGSEQDME